MKHIIIGLKKMPFLMAMLINFQHTPTLAATTSDKYNARAIQKIKQATASLQAIDKILTVEMVKTCAASAKCKQLKKEAFKNYSSIFSISQDIEQKMYDGIDTPESVTEVVFNAEILTRSLHEKHPTFYAQYD